MAEVKVRIAGLSGSPRKGGNTEYGLRTALAAAEELGNVETEFLSLSEKNINFCTGCGQCLGNPDPDILCYAFQDDLQPIAKQLFKADGVILASPTYIISVSGQLKTFIDRFVCTSSGNGMLMRNKVGGAITVAGARSMGAEVVLKTIHDFFIIMDMIPVGVGPLRDEKAHVSHGGLGTEGFPNARNSDIEKGVLYVEEDACGLESMRRVGRRVAELAKIVKLGMSQISAKETYWPVNKPITGAYGYYY